MTADERAADSPREHAGPRPSRPSAGAERYVFELIRRGESVRLPELFSPSRPGVIDDRARYRSPLRRSVQTVVLETSSLHEEELAALMRFRLAQCLSTPFADVEHVYRSSIEQDPLDHSS